MELYHGLHIQGCRRYRSNIFYNETRSTGVNNMRKIKEWFIKHRDWIDDFINYIYKVFVISALVFFFIKFSN